MNAKGVKCFVYYPKTRIPKGKPHHYAWEKDYRLQGGLWGGPAEGLELKGRALELGCGNGKGLKSIRAGELHAIDVSKTACGLARKECPEAKVVCGDICFLPFPDEFFDFVVARHAFGHLSAEERRKAAAECLRVLKPGGKLFFKDFAVGDLRYGKGVQVEENTFRRGNNAWYHYFSLGEATELFKDFRGEYLELEESEKKFGVRKWVKAVYSKRSTGKKTKN